MRRREWVLVLGSGLCVSVLPACTARRLVSQTAAPVRPQARLKAPLELPGALVSGGSPYHSLPLWPDTGEEQPVFSPDSAVSRAKFPVWESATPPGLMPSAEDTGAVAQQQPVLQATMPLSQPVDESPILQALRCFQEKRPAEAVQRLAGYDKVNQELLLAMMPLAVRLTEASLTQANPQEVTLMVDQLESVIGPLRRRAALTIEKMCFCRRIRGFEDFEPLPDDYYFRPGVIVQVYVQLRNFSCEPQDGLYATRLASTMEIKSFKGTYKRKQDLPGQTEYSKGLRHDYFFRCRFMIPDDIPPGLYTLSIRVVDQPDTPRQRVAERSLDFRVTR